MSKKKRKTTQKRSQVFLTNPDVYDIICSDGYTRLDKNPEIVTACRKIAGLISSMTIYLMSNTDNGDQRIVNELSRQIDINPNSYMTRKTWMDAIIMNLLLYGNGNSVVFPQTRNGLLGDMIVIPPSQCSFLQDGFGYTISINGTYYNPESLLHFVFNPDPEYPWKGIGITTTIKDVANNLKQAAATEKAFMQSKWKPSLIVKVDAMTEEFASPEGRKRLLDDYISTGEAGEPWMIPAEQFAVEQIRPLSLADLAIKDTVELDKRTVASIIGVPPFVLGIGQFNAQEWDNFISATIQPIAKIIEQELTKKLLINPRWYWKFNVSSLYSYDLKTMQQVFSELYVRGIVTGNEVRDKVNMSPKEGLDELVILENYIPLGSIGDQKKLGGTQDE